MKGDRKRKVHGFQPGNIPHNKGKTYKADAEESCRSTSPPALRRMDKETYSLVTVQSTVKGRQPTINIPDCEGNPGSARLLRPAPDVESSPENTATSSPDQHSGTRMVAIEQVIEMLNDVYRDHRDESDDCKDLHVRIAKEKKWGLGWRYQVCCVNCKFVSQEHKLYKEIETKRPGPNPAAVNHTFQAGLQDTPMGNSKARYLLAAADIPPPSRSAMQKTSNLVGKATKQLNMEDMKDKLETVRKTNELRGVSDPSVINVAFDARYNSPKLGSSKKPGTASSQAIGIACETVTDRKFIVGMAV